MTKQEQIEEMRSKIYHAMNSTNGVASANDIAETLYGEGYRKAPNDITELIDVLAEGAKIKTKIKRLEKENAFLLKACEEKFTFDTTQNKKYSVFNTVRKVFADEVKAKIDELLEEYENDQTRTSERNT